MNITLPDWISEVPLPTHTSDEAVMRYAIELAAMNVRMKTGGPFAAVVLNAHGGVVGTGVNLVTSKNCAVLHAEIVAIINASENLQTWSLGSMGHITIVITAEPCAMCMGAIPWAGIHRVVTSVRDQDVRALGFDEGNKPQGWIEHYHSRNIAVHRDVLRTEGVALLEMYKQSGGIIYNGANK